ncbi:hypothetical protein Pint_12472 [Pistacia integerrima]|uniref:Uncharacterized protein n=1 Tax=Pistacia integerrima TaxID=434235 RepID=A0ACC0YA02_9ROSI|nr:hypothetical protein Pint_12472 [Pistacia integerrima]
MMMMVKDEWVTAAMTDDSVVVELLVRLKQTQAASMTTSVAKSAMAAALRWGIRQPRSRSLRCDRVKEGDSTNTMRASPTTPLSWSGGGGSASPSATVDAFEETSRHQTFAARSKVRSESILKYLDQNVPVYFRISSSREGTATNETTSNSSKRSRKRKTFAELKEEESLLLKERIHLKKEIETLRSTFKEQSAKNENLKRMKLDLGLHSAFEPDKAGSTLVHKRAASSHDQIPSTSPSQSVIVDLPSSGSSETEMVVSERNSLSFLPDLNMMPSEDDSGSETLYGTS